jgi:hypothetical protein
LYWLDRTVFHSCRPDSKPQNVTNKAKKKTPKYKLEMKTKYWTSRMNDLEEKRFSFYADKKEKKTVSRPAIGTLSFARNTSQLFVKVKR